MPELAEQVIFGKLLEDSFVIYKFSEFCEIAEISYRSSRFRWQEPPLVPDSSTSVITGLEHVHKKHALRKHRRSSEESKR